MPARATRRCRSFVSGVATCVVLALGGAPAHAEPVAGRSLPEVAPDPVTEYLLQLIVNDETAGDPRFVLQTADQRWWLATVDAARLRLRLPTSAERQYHGRTYVPVDALAAVEARFDSATQTLRLAVPPAAFVGSTTSLTRSLQPEPTTPSPGAFFNYDVAVTRAATRNDFSGIVELGLFSRFGVLETSAVAASTAEQRGLTRLDTVWTVDFPRRLASLRIGDAISVPGMWGRSIRFGGVQYATNFGTQPGFVSYPMIAASGQAALPSTVDVFVNNALVAQQDVPPGPFSISGIPTITGAGDVQLVVRDVNGREQVVTQSFYRSGALLAPGLEQFAYEAGSERINYGLQSADYRDAFAAATYRRGITDDVTAEGHAEVSRALVAAGGGATYQWRQLGTLSGAMAASRHRGDTGALAVVTFNRQMSGFSAGLTTQWTTRAFHLLGESPEAPTPRVSSAASASYTFANAGTVTAAWVRQTYHDAALHPGNELVTLGYTVNLSRWAVLGVSATRELGGAGGSSTNIFVAIPFGTRDFASIGATRTRETSIAHTNATLAVQRNLPLGDGYGYRVTARGRDDVTAAVAWNAPQGSYSVEAARFQDETAFRISAAGGVGLLGGHAFAARPIRESFGVVEVGDYPGVSVLFDNQPVARTDAKGVAILPFLRAYDINRISIDPRDLPLDATVERLAVRTVPYYRSGVLVQMPIRRSRGATFRVQLEDGNDVPPGAVVTREGSDEAFPVGLGGQAYVTGLAAENRLHVSWPRGRCSLDLAYVQNADPLPDLGTRVCRRDAP
jgi:outer membrane usher protein